MCGVGGIYFYKSNEVINLNDLESIQKKLFHRGPDAKGMELISNSLGLIHTRLKIIDISDSANQPFSDHKRNILSYNGEIYNFNELRKDDYQYKTNSDVEVLSVGLALEGIEFLKKIEGMYAFAYWSEEQESLTLARDHVGIKPLYYYDDGQKLIFASEIKAITEVDGVDLELDHASINEYFKLGYIISPDTGFRNIKQLNPGEHIVVSKGIVNHTHVDYVKNFKHKKHLDPVATFSNQLKKSVKSHLVADVPITVYLSGGMDSSSIASCLKEGGQEYSLSTLGNKNANFSEVSKAQYVADRLEKKLLILDNESTSKYSLGDIVYYSDDLICDPALISNYELYEKTSKKYKVGISGDGADELFLGYHVHLATLISESALFKILKPVLKLISKPFVWFSNERSKYPISLKINRFFKFSNYPYPINHLSWRSPDITDLLKNYNEERLVEKANKLNITKEFSLKQSMVRLDLKTYLEGCILKKVDRMSMAHSVEARVPYLSRDFMSYSLGLPENMRMRWGKQKIIMRKYLKKYFSSMVYRQTKRGFGSDLKEVLANVEYKDFLFDNKSNVFNQVVDISKLKLFVDTNKNTYDYFYAIYTLVTFKYWLKIIGRQ